MSNPTPKAVQITLEKSAQTWRFDCASGSLLDALAQHKVFIPYQCRAGYCGTCRVRLLHGSVRYQSQPLAFLRADDILPCCCTVETDLVLDL